MSITSRQLNQRILRLALPNILTNITVPLLGMVDLALTGHLEDSTAIGGIAIATTLFNLIYWNFSFLRMGTTGLTAQAHGTGDRQAQGRNLAQSLLIGLSIGLLIILLRSPLLYLLMGFMNPEPQLLVHATTYFQIVVWGAPAVLATYALNGWMIGMQNSWWPMVVSIITNVVNIAISASLVLLFDWQIEGVATGTVIAQWVGAIALALGVYFIFYRKEGIHLPKSFAEWARGIKHYFTINVHIYFRTLLLALVSLFFTYAGTQQGALTLAANALLYQFFSFFSYFIDGFAYAAEAVVGHFYGRHDAHPLRWSVRKLVSWGLALALLTSLIYFVGAQPFLTILTDKADVIAHAQSYLPWVFVLPLAGFVAFLYDGIFVGITATKEMLISMVVAVVVFFLLYYANPFTDQNHSLWFAFVTYLALRGVGQILLSRQMRGLGKPFAYTYYISVGSTLVEKEQEIADLLLSKWAEAELSSFYQTTDATGKSDTIYTNTVLRLHSELDRKALERHLKAIEAELGRDRNDPHVVVLDLDLVVQDGKVLRSKEYQAGYFQTGYQELQ